jgi:(p)ppGpp synthase/HD superfamily hydrolase
VSTFAKALAIAMRHHAGVMDKTGKEPYILHPIRVARSVRHHGEEFAMAAVLHDTCEDPSLHGPPLTLDYLRKQGFSDRVVSAVDALTRRGTHGAYTETYRQFTARAGQHPIAKIVKKHDILDNLNRIQGLPDNERKGLTKRYQRALADLGEMAEALIWEALQPCP